MISIMLHVLDSFLIACLVGLLLAGIPTTIKDLQTRAITLADAKLFFAMHTIALIIIGRLMTHWGQL